ncbi:MAG: hypothetical protein ACXV5P_05870 [Halobacteriota archaeon]
MKDYKTKQQFITLRAQGKSYNTISLELGVSKPTLIKWGREAREEVENLTAIELDALKERYRLTRNAQVKRYGQQLERALQELETRDFSDVPTDKLLNVIVKIDAQLEHTCPTPIIRDDEELLRAKKAKEHEFAIDVDSSVIHAPDLVKLPLDVLRRYKAGEISERVAMHEIGLINSLFKAVERLEKRDALCWDTTGTAASITYAMKRTNEVLSRNG